VFCAPWAVTRKAYIVVPHVKINRHLNYISRSSLYFVLWDNSQRDWITAFKDEIVNSVTFEKCVVTLYSHSVVSRDGNCVILHLCSGQIQFLLMDMCRLLWFIVCCVHMHLAKPNRGRFTMTVHLVSVVFYMQNSRRGGVAVDTADRKMHTAGSVKSLKTWTTGRLYFLRRPLIHSLEYNLCRYEYC